jgi:hypothetical protein
MPPKKGSVKTKPVSRAPKKRSADAEDDEDVDDAQPASAASEDADAAPGSACHLMWGEKEGNSEDIALANLERAPEEKQIRCAGCMLRLPACV